MLISRSLFFGGRIPALTSFNLRRNLMERATRPGILLPCIDQGTNQCDGWL
jgi:hypothetical protein